jgi:MFS family permease
VDNSSDKKLFVFFGCSLGSLSFLSFYLLQGLWAAFLGVLLLGLSSSFVLAAQTAYMLKLKVTQEFGEGKAIGIFRSSSRIGQALGPMVFSTLVVAGDLRAKVTTFGLIYLLAALLFLLFTQRDRGSAVMEHA